MGTPYCSPGFGDGGKPRGPHSRGWGMQTLVNHYALQFVSGFEKEKRSYLISLGWWRTFIISNSDIIHCFSWPDPCITLAAKLPPIKTIEKKAWIKLVLVSGSQLGISSSLRTSCRSGSNRHDPFFWALILIACHPLHVLFTCELRFTGEPPLLVNLSPNSGNTKLES